MNIKNWRWLIYENEGNFGKPLYSYEEFMILFRQTGILDYICQHGTIKEMYDYLEQVARKDCIYCLTDILEDGHGVRLDDFEGFRKEEFCEKCETDVYAYVRYDEEGNSIEIHNNGSITTRIRNTGVCVENIRPQSPEEYADRMIKSGSTLSRESHIKFAKEQLMPEYIHSVYEKK